MQELGSLLDHSGVVGEAERKAAEVFGADRTYFVTGGTSAANRIVWLGTVTPGDVVLVDRNCHASVMHAIVMTGAVPIYLIPARNEYGIIGPPVRSSEFRPEVVAEKVRNCPLIDDPASQTVRMAVVTNSTYDGICYSAERIEEQLRDTVPPYIHFDEAWSGYARFHPPSTPGGSGCTGRERPGRRSLPPSRPIRSSPPSRRARCSTSGRAQDRSTTRGSTRRS